MQLLRSYPHRWGKGTTHLSWNSKDYVPRCRKYNHGCVINAQSIHGQYMEGTIDDVTCKNCRKIYFRINPKEQEKLLKMEV